MLSNISVKGTNRKIGGNQAEGQWVQKNVTVFSGETFTATGAQTFTISNYLPDNDYVYEVLLGSYNATTSTSGNASSWWVRNEYSKHAQIAGYVRTRTSSSTKSGHSMVLPVQQKNGTLTLNINVTSVGGSCGLYLYAYRRLGGLPCVLTINPTPSDASVTFSRGTVSGKKCTVMTGTTLTYTVSKSSYVSKSSTVTIGKTQTTNVTLSEVPYVVDQVLYESSTGGASTTLNIEVAGKYQVICIAGGGGGAYNSRFKGAAGGGSGSGFNCVLQLSAGDYQISVGSGGAKKSGSSTSSVEGTTGGDSRFGDCYSRGGQGGYVSVYQPEGGSGGAAPTITYTISSTTLNTAGNAGSIGTSSSTSGGAAVYSSYGKGGNADSNGNAGYVKVVYKGQ